MQPLHAVLSFLPETLQENWVTALSVFAATLIILTIKSWLTPSEPPIDLANMVVPCGDITLEELTKYDGRDPFRPLYLAVQGDVYDVTKGRDFYGPGASQTRGLMTARFHIVSPSALAKH